MRKSRGSIFVFTALLLSGVLLLSYPHICRMKYEHKASRVIGEYLLQTQAQPDDEIEQLYQRMNAYNRTLFQERQRTLVDPFSYQQPDGELAEFGFAEGIVAYLEIPKLGLELPVYIGASTDNLRKGAAYLCQTSLPVGGESTNTVIAAHRGMSTAPMFREIHQLEPGDLILVTNFRETLRYRVAAFEIISPTEVERILIQESQDLVTLLSCHPYGRNSQRYVVYCAREMQHETGPIS